MIALWTTVAAGAPLSGRPGVPEGDNPALDWASLGLFLLVITLFARFANSPFPHEKKDKDA